MQLKQRLLEDLRGAMKEKNSLKVSTLRLISSEIKNKEIDLRNELNDEQIIVILSTQIKRRKEAAALYAKGERLDLKEQEEKEITVIEHYLPAPADEEELRSRIGQLISETGAQGAKDMGKVMKVMVPEFRGKADGELLKNLVLQMLNQ